MAKRKRRLKTSEIKSSLHPNIKIPKVKFSGLKDELQTLIITCSEILVGEFGLSVEEIGEDPVKATIELLDKGVLRIVYIKEPEGITFELFDFETGQYLPLNLPTKH